MRVPGSIASQTETKFQKTVPLTSLLQMPTEAPLEKRDVSDSLLTCIEDPQEQYLCLVCQAVIEAVHQVICNLVPEEW